MWKCPVCDKENTATVCPTCGYDRTCDYERYPTAFAVTTATPTHTLRRQWQEKQNPPVNGRNRKRTVTVTQEQAAQGCGGNGAGFVQLLHSAHNGGGINAIEQDAAVFRNAAQQVAAVFIFCFTHRINDLPKQGCGG